MRIVTMSDTHLRHGALDVPDGDVLVHAGDATMVGNIEQIYAFATWFRSMSHRTKIFVAGNHDAGFEEDAKFAARALGKNVVYLQDSGIVVDGVRFWGSPWQPWFLDWAFNLPRGGPALKATWDKIPTNTDVLVTHAPPFGVLDKAHGEHLGCELLRDRLTALNLRLHIFGHIHEGSGMLETQRTTFVNASICDGAYTPSNPVRVIDL